MSRSACLTPPRSAKRRRAHCLKTWPSPTVHASAAIFRGDGLVIRNSLFSDTSTEGLYVIGSSDVLLERNIFRRNNVEHLTGYYASAVKIFNQTRRVTVRDNLVLDNPESSGVWFDVGNRDGVFVNNYVEGAVNGFFFEISRGGDGGRQRLCALRPRHLHFERGRREDLQQHVSGRAGVV